MRNPFDFTGKVVLVTGASSGIGRATAEFFGECGASVAVSYLNNRAGAEAAVPAISAAANGKGAYVGGSNLKGGGEVNGGGGGGSLGKALAVRADVTQNTEIRRMIDE